jgi:hypothetical protein
MAIEACKQALARDCYMQLTFVTTCTDAVSRTQLVPFHRNFGEAFTPPKKTDDQVPPLTVAHSALAAALYVVMLRSSPLSLAPLQVKVEVLVQVSTALWTICVGVNCPTDASPLGPGGPWIPWIP